MVKEGLIITGLSIQAIIIHHIYQLFSSIRVLKYILATHLR